MREHGRNHYYSHIPLKETTLSPRIVQGILGILRNSLDQAVAEKLIPVSYTHLDVYKRQALSRWP